MIGANSILAFHDSAGVVTAITYEFSNFTPSVRDSNLSFSVYSREAEYSDGKYTIYATVALPGNRTTLNTVWQAGQVAIMKGDRNALCMSTIIIVVVGGGCGGFAFIQIAILGSPQALRQSCLTFGAFCIMEG
ncbi:hypothetical protein COCNU_13G007550 [Cocos nucifera]|uniref:DOMON domain-containing protein n=1 Tax=Cocos nucifera TaxID=13894 RepID=A0A8K0ITQ4_COCNU|nr:hypothetical protein COCNU_13G007550 [Cocos nucifera]